MPKPSDIKNEKLRELVSAAHTAIRSGDYTATGSGGGFSIGGTVTISNSQIYSNTANSSTLGGGGVFVVSSGNVTINNSQIYSNMAHHSIAILPKGTNCVFGLILLYNLVSW